MTPKLIVPGNWIRCKDCGWGWMIDDAEVTPQVVLGELKKHHGIEPQDAEDHVELVT